MTRRCSSNRKGDDDVDGSAIAEEVAASGRVPERVVATAERDGSVRAVISGGFCVTECTSKDGTSRHQHNVKADQIGVNACGQDVEVSGGRQQPTE